MNSERQIKIDADLTGRIDKVLGHFLSDIPLAAAEMD